MNRAHWITTRKQSVDFLTVQDVYGLDLANALAGDAEACPHLLERLRDGAVEAEAVREHVAHARVEPVERPGELGIGRILCPRAGGDTDAVFRVSRLLAAPAVPPVPLAAAEEPIKFTDVTAAGSLVWNAVLIGAGVFTITARVAGDPRRRPRRSGRHQPAGRCSGSRLYSTILR